MLMAGSTQSAPESVRPHFARTSAPTSAPTSPAVFSIKRQRTSTVRSRFPKLGDYGDIAVMRTAFVVHLDLDVGGFGDEAGSDGTLQRLLEPVRDEVLLVDAHKRLTAWFKC